MSTPFAGISDQIPQESSLPVDYSFLNYALSSKESQYEQGLAQVKQSYSSVANLPLSNPDNIAARNEYLQNAKTQVQALSKADLSLPQNVDKAGQIFAPFWQDPDMIADISKTKQIQDANQVAETTRTSTDDKIRGTYDSRIVPYLNQPLQELKEAKRGDGSMQAVQPRQFVPFQNVKQHLDDEADKEGLEINWFDDPKGPYLVKHTNGAGSVLNYKTWAASKIGDEFNAQFNVIGTVNKEARVNDYIQRGMSKQDAENKVGTDLYNSAAQNYTDNLSGMRQEAATYDKNIDDLYNIINTQRKGKLLSEDIARLDELHRHSARTKAQIKQTQPEVDDFLREDSKQDFIAHPENYLAKVVRQQIINDWSTGRAANESIDITPNQSYWNAQNLQYEDNWRNIEHTIALGKLGVDRYNAGMVDLQGNPITQAQKDQGTAAGPATQLLAHTDKVDLFNQTQQFIKGKAYTGIFSPNGLISTTKSLPGITDEDIKNVNTYMSAVTKGNSVEGTPEMKESFTKLQNALIGAGIKVDPNKDIISKYRDAILQYVPKYMTAMQANNHSGEAARVGLIAAGVNQNLDIFNGQTADRDKKIQDAINSDEYKNSPLIINRNGKRDIMNADDMAPIFPTIKAIAPNGNEVTLSQKDLAKAWLNGTFNNNKGVNSNISNNHTLTIDGIKYSNPSVVNGIHTEKNYGVTTIFDANGVPISKSPYGLGTTDLDLNIQHIKEKYGNPGDLTKEYNKLLDKTIPDDPYYSGETGQVMMKKRFGFGKGESGKDLTTELADPDNSNHIYTDPSMKPGTEATPAELDALRRKGGVDKPEDYFSKPVMVASGPKSSPVGILSVNASKKDQENDADLKEIGNKTFYIDVKPEAKSATLKRIMPEFDYTYQSPLLYNGKSIYSTPTEEAAGIKYSVTPDDAFNPKGATIDATYTSKNPKTGDSVNNNYTRYFGFDQYNPNALIKGLNQGNAAHYNNMTTNQNERNRTGTTGMTLQEYKKSRGIN